MIEKYFNQEIIVKLKYSLLKIKKVKNTVDFTDTIEWNYQEKREEDLEYILLKGSGIFIEYHLIKTPVRLNRSL